MNWPCWGRETRILDEFSAVMGYHRKHAMRLLRTDALDRRTAPRPERRLYDEAVREALIVLWEASDKVCGKRLKALAPALVEAMERHGIFACPRGSRVRSGDECGDHRLGRGPSHGMQASRVAPDGWCSAPGL